MKGSRRGDFSRLTFDPAKHYNAVLMQQGRVQLDADWNEHVEILAHRFRSQVTDTIGPAGAPAGCSGFEIVPQAALRFDGKSHYLTLGHAGSAAYSAAAALAVEADVEPREGGAGGVLLCRYDRIEPDAPLQYTYMLAVLPDGRLRFHHHDGAGDLLSERPVPFGRWSRVALVHDRRECRLSIDGRPAGALPGGYVRDSLGALFLVGQAQLKGDGPAGFDGRLRELRLSGGERATAADELLGWWRFDRVEGEVVLDLSGNATHALLGGGKPAARPRLELDDLLVSAGRFYAGGVLCENERTVSLRRQPELPGLELPGDRAAGRTYLVYLDVWERHVASAHDPALREPALGGADTACRSQIVAQTRWLPLEVGEPPAAPVAELDAWRRLVSGGRPAGRLRVRRPEGASGRLDNQLYRIEIHTGGGLSGGSRPAPPASAAAEIESVAAAERRVTLGQWPEGAEALAANDWVELWSSQTETGGSGLLTRIEQLDPARRVVTLADALDTLDGQRGLRLRRLASFKWSRDNASLAVPVASLEPDNRVVALAPAGQDEPAFAPGDWVELADDRSSLAGGPARLHRVTGCDPETRTLTLEHPPGGDGDAAARPTVAVRWDGYEPIRAGSWQPLEKGIEARFADGDVADAGPFRAGDYWLFAARTAGATVDWPVDSDGEPAARPPDGVDHHLSPLAVLSFTETGFELRDCRPVFQPLSTGAVSKAGDRMHGPLEIRPRPEGAAATSAPALLVDGTAQADTLLGKLGSPAAVETFALGDAAVTRSKISPDVGTVPAGFAILGSSPTPPPGYEATGCALMVPDPEPGWTTRTTRDIGEQPGELHSAAIGGRVWTFADSGRAWSYDPADGALTEHQPMPEPRRRFAAAAAHGKVYLVGGVDHQDEKVAATLEYDPGLDAWSWRREMPTPRCDLALVEADGKLHAVGGLRDLAFLEIVSRRHEVYDPLVDHWDRRRALPTARYALCAAAGRQGIFAFGGRRRWFLRWLGQTISAINEEYLPGVDRWARRPNPMPTPRSHAGAAVIGDAVLVVGGRSLFGWSTDTSSYAPQGDAWSRTAALPAPAVSPGVAAVGGKLIVHVAGSRPGSLEVAECRIAAGFHVHRKSAAPEGDLEPQLRRPAGEEEALDDLELPRLSPPAPAREGS